MHLPVASRGANRKSLNRIRARQGAAATVMNSLLRFASFLAPGPFILDEELPSADTATTEGRTNPPTSPLLTCCHRLQRPSVA